ncbi:magnesium-protoporphyrin IX monomethyl ester (oxidative) cyclase [Brasilonema octagenarum]|uniref:Magnesium-protoporphyrin IX monomethyl ester [oxidative] cyclase n=1 Tax=Brasilonema octagenarum UFV-OR1 TaxID=417115 RepID=A0ABX1MED6_9CYAN|nr:magnesium-protoporphyrin IX monomethyl ester (oxidative) cyclase [Brasilonema octagenarum]NMF67013.1 magnesium-protoporphyrin IX monomethyl ester (oxidative) cyclase [Brasilonema octagenarum UFV-OR1]
MAKSLQTPAPELQKPGVKAPVQETLLTPRFYTTDFDAVAQLDISADEAQLRAIVDELRADYNRHHFVRDSEFQQSWDMIDGETRRAFIDFLERSCTSEFSGFLLFKELSRRLKQRNPLLAEAFNFMARDEARHAGFLNKAMADFNLSLDLGYLTKNRTYTFFPPEWIIYAVYLSEKIGYWRYIIMFRHLEKHPELKFYPLFGYFESWCQDENRHGDFFKALLRSQPQLWNNWKARLWVRFFLLSVFATHTLTVLERASFYHSIGINAYQYNIQVIEKTNETAARAFPVILNTDHPEFFRRLEECSDINLKLTTINISNSQKIVKFFQKLPLILSIIGHLLRLYFIKPIDAEVSRQAVC